MNKWFLLLTVVSQTSLTWAADPLVSDTWVRHNSCNQDVVVLDIRNPIGGGGSHAAYLAGHVPCAVYSDYTKGWRSTVDGIVGQLPPAQDLATLIGNLGIGNESHVVIVSGGKSASDMGSATRVYWTFKVLGHDEVSILDGGMAAYHADKANPLQTEQRNPTPATFTANLQREMLVSKADVKNAIDQGSVTLIDHRPEDMYLGVNKHGKAKRAGTIPNSLNVPERWITANGGGRFRDANSLSQLFNHASVPADAEQINFCNTGHWASLGWFASHELLGNKKAKLYDGSMVEWSADDTLPMDRKIEVKK